MKRPRAPTAGYRRSDSPSIARLRLWLGFAAVVLAITCLTVVALSKGVSLGLAAGISASALLARSLLRG